MSNSISRSVTSRILCLATSMALVSVAACAADSTQPADEEDVASDDQAIESNGCTRHPVFPAVGACQYWQSNIASSALCAPGTGKGWSIYRRNNCTISPGSYCSNGVVRPLPPQSTMRSCYGGW